VNLIYTSCISEATFAPKILAIEERDSQYYEYEPSQISRELISGIQWMGVEDRLDAVLKILENQTPNLVTLEYLVVEYPSLKEKLLPYLRDKKLDELI
jgi:hypothetical protein